MAPDLRSLINSRYGTGFALALARITPPWLGHRLIAGLSNLVSGRSMSPIIRATRVNQWVVSHQALSAEELDRVVRATFRSIGRSLYDTYHNLGNLPAMRRLIEFDATFEAFVERNRRHKEGMIVVGTHLSNVDMVMLAAAMSGVKALTIHPPNPSGGYQWQNKMRRESGLDPQPAQLSVLKEAISHLRGGGTVLTGMDRPIADAKYRPRFFGRPAQLPVNYTMLALKAEVPVIVAAVFRQPSGVYRLSMSEDFHMASFGDRESDLVLNTERLLCKAEEYVSQAPTQWAMTYPVWPDALAVAP
jgi:KDO2-lipid IV(A) lauroyltransferase